MTPTQDAAAPSATNPGGTAVGIPAGSATPGQLPAGPELSPGLMKIALAMSEDELLSKITLGPKREPGICEQLGLGWIHHRRSQMTNPGWPDLVIKAPAGRTGILFRELKKQRGKVTADQEEWLTALILDGMDACVWRPEDYLTGRIARKLAALAGMSVTS